MAIFSDSSGSEDTDSSLSSSPDKLKISLLPSYFKSKLLTKNVRYDVCPWQTTRIASRTLFHCIQSILYMIINCIFSDQKNCLAGNKYVINKEESPNTVFLSYGTVE